MLPEKWDVEFFKLDEKGFLKGLKVGRDPQKIALSGQVIDLTTVSNGADNAAIRGFVNSDKAQTLWLVMGSKSLVMRYKPTGTTALPIAPVNFVTCDGPKGNASKPDFSYISVTCTPEKLHVKSIDEKGKKFDEFEIDRQGTLKTLYLDDEIITVQEY